MALDDLIQKLLEFSIQIFPICSLLKKFQLIPHKIFVYAVYAIFALQNRYSGTMLKMIVQDTRSNENYVPHNSQKIHYYGNMNSKLLTCTLDSISLLLSLTVPLELSESSFIFVPELLCSS